MDQGLVASIEDGLRYSVAEYIEARGEKLAYCDSVRPLFEKYDLLLTPSVSVTAFAVGCLNPAHWPQHEWDWFPWAGFSYPFNFTGQPAVSVPAGFADDGLPIGAQLVGPFDSEGRLISLSAQLEAARGWPAHRPAVAA
jgi:aspartyl-tRNA(Asn)/glutamyl-tRNA(Gln) amidotransferase subunit A